MQPFGVGLGAEGWERGWPAAAGAQEALHGTGHTWGEVPRGPLSAGGEGIAAV